jgi:hypothetical protein
MVCMNLFERLDSKIPLPREILAKSDKQLGNITWYLNTTDSHYHVKGLVKNILPENTDSIIVVLGFFDQTTGNPLHHASVSIDRSLTGGIVSNAILSFDIYTGYIAGQAISIYEMEHGMTPLKR